MRVAIIEDDAEDRDRLTAWLDRYGRERRIPVMADVYASAAEAGLRREDGPSAPEGRLVLADAEVRRRFRSYGMILLDMFLPLASAAGEGDAAGDGGRGDGGPSADAIGMDVARALRAAGVRCPIVFETVSVDYAVPGYEVASGYLVKPFGYARLAETIDRLAAVSAETVTIPLERRDGGDGASAAAGAGDGEDGTEGRRFRADAVIRLEVRGHYLDIVLTDGRATRLRTSMAAAERALEPDGRFHRCSRGVIVNLDHVDRMERDAFVLDDGSEVRISRRGVAAARDAWYGRGLRRLNPRA